MKTFNLIDALVSKYSNANWNMFGTSYDDLEWTDTDIPKPSKRELLDEIYKITKDYENSEYKRQRVNDYPSIGDQLDALFKAGVFPEEMAAQIQAVKDKYPKV